MPYSDFDAHHYFEQKRGFSLDEFHEPSGVLITDPAAREAKRQKWCGPNGEAAVTLWLMVFFEKGNKPASHSVEKSEKWMSELL